jgi:hypothetical protein
MPLAKLDSERAAAQQADMSAFWKGNKSKHSVSFDFRGPSKGQDVNLVEAQLNGKAYLSEMIQSRREDGPDDGSAREQSLRPVQAGDPSSDFYLDGDKCKSDVHVAGGAGLRRTETLSDDIFS